MSRIPLDTRGNKARFFAESGTDEVMSMVLELTAELWTVKERLYALEQAAGDAGLDLTGRIEAWQPSEAQAGELDEARAKMIATVLRSIETRHVRGSHLRKSLDDEAAAMAGNQDWAPRETPIRAA